MSSGSLILASQSPRRRELLLRSGVAFSIEPCPLREPEVIPDGVSAAWWAESLAYFKSRAVADVRTDHWVLGADTVVACAGLILGKPCGIDDARRMLTLQAGRAADVITGIALIRKNDEMRRIIEHERTRVWLRNDPALIESYLRGRDWRGKAGAYGIQDVGDTLIERIEGSFDNVVGLPTERLKRHFERLGL